MLSLVLKICLYYLVSWLKLYVFKQYMWLHVMIGRTLKKVEPHNQLPVIEMVMNMTDISSFSVSVVVDQQSTYLYNNRIYNSFT